LYDNEAIAFSLRRGLSKQYGQSSLLPALPQILRVVHNEERLCYCDSFRFASFSSSALSVKSCSRLFIRTIMRLRSLGFSRSSFLKKPALSISLFSRILGCSPVLCRPRWRSRPFVLGPTPGAPAPDFTKQLLCLAYLAASVCPTLCRITYLVRYYGGSFPPVILCRFLVLPSKCWQSQGVSSYYS